MDAILFTNPFLEVVDRDGYAFVHEARCDGNIVSLLPFRRTSSGRQYLARRETCPAHTSISEQPELCSITGGIDPGDTPLETAQHELKEEAGYTADTVEFISLGSVRPSKALDTVVHLFAIDVTGKQQDIALGDGTKWEVGASVEWVSKQKGLQIGDPLFIASLARLQNDTIRSHT